MTRSATLALAALLVAVPAMAQEHDHHPTEHGPLATAEGVPEGWIMRLDRPDAALSMVDFQVMEPGWHVTTGRAGAGIFWMPGMTATGPYQAQATFHLFDPASHAEAFGLFVGGEELGEADQEYVYFLVRQTGEYLIKRRHGSETSEVVGWTRHEAIPVAPAGEKGPTRYQLAVVVGTEEVELRVNGATVHRLPADRLDTSGAVGLRINHMLDLHVEEIALEPTG